MFAGLMIVLAYGLAFAVIGVFLIVGAQGFLEYLDRRAQDRFWHVQELARRDIGVQISMRSYWFSENEEAMLLVKALGDHLRNGNHFDPDKIRDSWRNSVRTSRKPHQEPGTVDG